MNMQTLDIAGIYRPKLLMAAAKVIVRRNISQAQKPTVIPELSLKKLVQLESEIELLRKNRSPEYRANKQIELLARLIEQASLRYLSVKNG